MKTTIQVLLLLASAHIFAQVTLSDKDFKNLVALSQAYAKNVNAGGKDFDATIKKLSTPKLKHMVETFTF